MSLDQPSDLADKRMELAKAMHRLVDYAVLWSNTEAGAETREVGGCLYTRHGQPPDETVEDIGSHSQAPAHRIHKPTYTYTLKGKKRKKKM